MLVKNWMSKPAITIDEDESMYEATKLLKNHNIKMLPVMRKGKARRDYNRSGSQKSVGI